MFLVGAGVSIASGLPNFREFSAHVISATTGDEEAPEGDVLRKHEVEQFVRQLRPEVVAQVLSETLGDCFLDFYEWFEEGRPNRNHDFLAAALRQGHWVVTTNFDDLLEQACNREPFKFTPRVCVDDKDYEDFLRERAELATAGGPGIIFKMHGQINREKAGRSRYTSILAALNEVGRGLGKSQAEFLRTSLKENDLIALGYSSCDHFSLQPVLAGAKTDSAVYWLQYVDKENEIENPRFGLTEIPHMETDSARLQQTFEDLRYEFIFGEPPPGHKAVLPKRHHGIDVERFSVLEIVASRSQPAIWYGDTTVLLTRLVEEHVSRLASAPHGRPHKVSGPRPKWCDDLSQFQRLLIAARLSYRMRDVSATLGFAKAAMDRAGSKHDRGLALRLQGEAHVLLTTPNDDKEAVRFLRASLAEFADPEDIPDAIEARLELANALRRAKEPPEKVLEQTTLVERLVEGNRDLTKRLRLKALVRTRIARGLLASDAEADRLLGDAAKIAEDAGEPALRASSLNAKGLKSRDNSGFSDLDVAFGLFRLIGDGRGCFQARRNRGLKWKNVPDIDDKEKLELERRDLEAALLFITVHGGGLPGEVNEAKLGLGDVLVRQGMGVEAESILQEAASHYAASGDWHRHSRALELLVQATSIMRLNRLETLLAIHVQLLNSPDGLRALANEKGQTRLRTTYRIVRNSCEAALDLGNELLAREFAKIQDELGSRAPLAST